MTRRPTRTELFEEIDWLLNMGEHPTHIAQAVGIRATTLERYAHEADRRDLAAIFREATKKVIT